MAALLRAPRRGARAPRQDDDVARAGGAPAGPWCVGHDRRQPRPGRDPLVLGSRAGAHRQRGHRCPVAHGAPARARFAAGSWVDVDSDAVASSPSRPCGPPGSVRPTCWWSSVTPRAAPACGPWKARLVLAAAVGATPELRLDGVAGYEGTLGQRRTPSGLARVRRVPRLDRPARHRTLAVRTRRRDRAGHGRRQHVLRSRRRSPRSGLEGAGRPAGAAQRLLPRR